jgi:hypothetical protein
VFLFSTSAISIASFSATAAPVVDGYTMDFGSTGGTIRLNGSGFTRGPDVALYDNFDGRSPGGTVSLSDPIVGRWGSTSNNPRYVIESDGNGGFLARNFDLTSGGKLAQLQALFDRPEREIFYSFSVKVPQGFHFSGASSPDEFSTQSSWKFSWLYSGQKGYGHDDGLFDVTVPTHVGSGNFAVAGNSGGLSYINNGREWWDWGSFNHFGYYMKISDDAETTDSIDWLLRIASAKNNIVRGGDTPRSSYQGTDYQFDRLNFPGWWGNGSGENFSAIYDNVYIAVGENANSRIVASDKENIDSSTKVVTLPPNNWSDEQIELDFTLLPNWKEVYIHVVDSNGKFSDKGIRVCMECPNPIFPSIK